MSRNYIPTGQRRGRPPGGKNRKYTKAKAWREPFLVVLRKTCNVRMSCEAAGITRTHALREYDDDPDFKKSWDEAVQDALDVLETIAMERARQGSDAMIMFLLRSRRPEIYAPKERDKDAPFSYEDWIRRLTATNSSSSAKSPSNHASRDDNVPRDYNATPRENDENTSPREEHGWNSPRDGAGESEEPEPVKK